MMLLYLKIKPNQRFDRIEKSGHAWIVKLKARPVEGEANERLVQFLSNILDLPKSSIKLVKGQTARIKCLEIDADAALITSKLSMASEESAQ